MYSFCLYYIFHGLELLKQGGDHPNIEENDSRKESNNRGRSEATRAEESHGLLRNDKCPRPPRLFPLLSSATEKKLGGRQSSLEMRIYRHLES